METSAEPDTPNLPVALVPARKLSEELAYLQATFAEKPVQLHEVIEVLKGRAYLLLLVMLSLPFCTPVPVPGLSTPFGFVVGLISLRLMLGQKPWLPQKLLRTQLPAGFFFKLISFTRRIIRLIEKFLRPRLVGLTSTPLLVRLHAAAMLISASVLLLPLPIPFSNTFPAWVILLMAGGLLERDGVFVIAGYVMFAAGVVFFLLLGEAAQQLFETAKNWLFG